MRGYLPGIPKEPPSFPSPFHSLFTLSPPLQSHSLTDVTRSRAKSHPLFTISPPALHFLTLHPSFLLSEVVIAVLSTLISNSMTLVLFSYL